MFIYTTTPFISFFFNLDFLIKCQLTCLTPSIDRSKINPGKLTEDIYVMSEKDYSIDAFNRFFDHAAEKGLIKRNTAISRKAATNKILAVLEKSELTDLRTLDLDSTFERFQNLQGMKYKPDSMQVYMSRARTAVGDFIAYVDNPASFKSSTTQRSNTKTKSGGTEAKGKVVKKQKDTDDELDQHGIKHIIVPIPLRENLTVKISNLPADLTQAEADRLAAIVKAYAVPSVD
jgi:hypothetical protein